MNLNTPAIRHGKLTEADFFASSCTGQCNQGRACTCHPAPAEACTEVGSDADPRASALFWSVYIVIIFVAVVAGLAALA